MASIVGVKANMQGWRFAIPQLDITALIIAYIALATLLLGFNLYSYWN